jgi:hypothetical protein
MAKLTRTTRERLIKLSLESVLASSDGKNWVPFACGKPYFTDGFVARELF